MDVAKLKADWTGFEFDESEFTIEQDSMIDCAEAAGEIHPRFVDPAHDEFQAIPTYTTRFVGRRMWPEGFPRIGKGFGFDAGKCVEIHAPIRPGDVLVARSEVADVYEKTGRSGSMIFIVHRMRFTNQRDELVSVVDWRLMQRSE